MASGLITSHEPAFASVIEWLSPSSSGSNHGAADDRRRSRNAQVEPYGARVPVRDVRLTAVFLEADAVGEIHIEAADTGERIHRQFPACNGRRMPRICRVHQLDGSGDLSSRPKVDLIGHLPCAAREHHRVPALDEINLVTADRARRQAPFAQKPRVRGMGDVEKAKSGADSPSWPLPRQA